MEFAIFLLGLLGLLIIMLIWYMVIYLAVRAALRRGRYEDRMERNHPDKAPWLTFITKPEPTDKS